jgi:hypothetical protein
MLFKFLEACRHHIPKTCYRVRNWSEYDRGLVRRGDIRSMIADGACDGAPAYEAIRAARPKGSPAKIIIPPGKPSIPAKGEPHGGTERERHAAEIAARGRMAWQRRHGYGPSDRWLRPPYPGSNGSMAGGWLPEL